jgi:hypothetical protein
MDYYGYDGGHETYLCFKRPQTNEEYNRDLITYHTKQAEYDEWHKANKKEIETEIEERKQKSFEKQRRFIDREKKRLQKELDKLEGK